MIKKKKDILLKMTYRIFIISLISSVHVKFCCRSAKSLSFNWFVEIFAKKYGVFSLKIGTRKGENPFPVT